jgi:pyruvate,water dikinase
MRLWAAFRARMLQQAAEAGAQGFLERPEQIWLLTTAELQSLPPYRWRERAGERASEQRVRGREGGREGETGKASTPATGSLPLSQSSPAVTADIFWSDTLAPLGAAPSDRLPLVAGAVTGPALVARTPSEALALLAELPASDGRPVLIAPAVDPGWLPVFVRVGGVATELGGRLSHAATLLRELGIPSVLNLAGAMQCARTGERVCLRVPPGTVEIV